MLIHTYLNASIRIKKFLFHIAHNYYFFLLFFRGVNLLNIHGLAEEKIFLSFSHDSHFLNECFVSIFYRSTEQQISQQQQQHHRPKSVQLPFCINDSLSLAKKHYNQKKIKQIRFLFKHRESCLLQRNNLVKRFQSQPNINRNWNCEECGL